MRSRAVDGEHIAADRARHGEGIHNEAGNRRAVIARPRRQLLGGAAIGIAMLIAYRETSRARDDEAERGDLSVAQDDRASKAVQALNGELASLRAEINSRLSSQQVTLGAYLTAVAAVTGFAVNKPDHTLLLLAIPLLAVILGSVFLSHSWTINLLGAYIRDTATPFIRCQTLNELPCWEDMLAIAGRRSPARVTTAFMTYLVFAALPAVALAATFRSARDATTSLVHIGHAYFAVWIVDLVLLVFWLMLALSNAGSFWRPINRRLTPTGGRSGGE
jgi:hypothetical protein